MLYEFLTPNGGNKKKTGGIKTKPNLSIQFSPPKASPLKASPPKVLMLHKLTLKLSTKTKVKKRFNEKYQTDPQSIHTHVSSNSNHADWPQLHSRGKMVDDVTKRKYFTGGSKSANKKNANKFV